MKKEKIKGIILIAAIILIGVIAQLYNQRIQKQPKIYTIGTIDQIYSTASMEIKAGYYYSINGEIYSNSKNIYGYQKVTKVGERFIVQVPVGYYDHGVMLFEYPVPKGIEAPRGGWTELPDFLKK